MASSQRCCIFSATPSWCSNRAFIEASALGLIGGFDSAFNKLVFDKHQATIWAGFILLAVLYFVGWEALLQP